MKHIVGIGEMAVSKREGDCLVTYALSSCVAVAVYSPSRRAAGLLHVALPHPAYPEQARVRPCYYASTGIPSLIDKLCTDFHCHKSDLWVGLYGGACSINPQDFFHIGKRNIQACVDTLLSLHIKANALDLGGTVSRSLRLHVPTGAVTITTQPLII